MGSLVGSQLLTLVVRPGDHGAHPLALAEVRQPAGSVEVIAD